MGASSHPLATPSRWKMHRLSEFDHRSTSSAGLLPFDGLHVLVVDDNEITRLLAVEVLHQLGVAAMQAADGAQAVTLACELEFDLILMDLQMPMLGGVEATRQIPAFEGGSRWARVPIVAHTSTLLQGEWQGLRDSGFDDVLDKPCALTTMSACLRRWCPQSRLSKRELPRSSNTLDGG